MKQIKEVAWVGMTMVLLVPHYVIAQNRTPPTSSGPGPGSFPNPLRYHSIDAFIAALLKVIVAVGTPIAIVFLVFSGFLFVTAQGNEEKLRTAKKALTWTVVGLAVLLGAQLFAGMIEATIQDVTP